MLPILEAYMHPNSRNCHTNNVEFIIGISSNAIRQHSGGFEVGYEQVGSDSYIELQDVFKLSFNRIRYMQSWSIDEFTQNCCK